MKDFRADQGSHSKDGTIFGGSAFHLPNIFDSFSGISAVLTAAGLTALFSPLRLLRALPYRRGGLIGSFFAWGRLASIALAFMLIFSPALLQHAIPGWHTIALVCFVVSGLSVMAAISRCCGSIASCAFWVVLTLFLGEKAFKPYAPGEFIYSAPAFQDSQPKYVPAVSAEAWTRDLPKVEGEWEDMVTGVPISNHLITLARSESLSRLNQIRFANQSNAPANSAAVERGATRGSVAGSVTSSLNSIIPSFSGASSFIPSPFSHNRDFVDGPALPDSAYFGGAKVGAVGGAMEGGGGDSSGIDGVINQVKSFFKN